MTRKKRKKRKRKTRRKDCAKEVRKICKKEEELVLLFDRVAYLEPAIPAVAEECPGHEASREAKALIKELKARIAELIDICERLGKK